MIVNLFDFFFRIKVSFKVLGVYFEDVLGKGEFILIFIFVGGVYGVCFFVSLLILGY